MGEIEQVGTSTEIAVAELEEECARLSRVGSLLAEGLDQSTPSSWHPRLERALRELIEHERNLQGSGSPHARLIEAVPGLYGKLRLLQTEHGALTRTVRRLAEATRSTDDPEEAERLRRQLRLLADRIAQHRQTTMEVVEAARGS